MTSGYRVVDSFGVMVHGIRVYMKNRFVWLKKRKNPKHLIEDVNPSRSLLCEAKQRSSMRSKNESSRGASKQRSPSTKTRDDVGFYQFTWKKKHHH